MPVTIFGIDSVWFLVRDCIAQSLSLVLISKNLLIRSSTISNSPSIYFPISQPIRANKPTIMAAKNPTDTKITPMIVPNIRPLILKCDILIRFKLLMEFHGRI